MICKNCGIKIDNDQKYCDDCQIELAKNPSNKIYGMMGFIFAMVGFQTGGFLSILGIIFCALHLRNHYTEHRGLAVAGLVISIITIVLTIISIICIVIVYVWLFALIGSLPA